MWFAFASRTPVPERKPDLYFRVVLPGGNAVDTRNMPGGFMVNAASLRVGSLANPLTFTLGGGRAVVAAG